MNIDNLKRADIAFILKEKKSVTEIVLNQMPVPACQYNIKSEPTCESALTTSVDSLNSLFWRYCPELLHHYTIWNHPSRDKHTHTHTHTHTHSTYSQEGRGAKPGRDRLYALPFLLINEAQEVIFRSGSLIPPKNTIFTAATHTHKHPCNTDVNKTIADVYPSKQKKTNTFI